MKIKAFAFIILAGFAATGCKKIAPGGNNSILKMEENQHHYTDDARIKYEGETKKPEIETVMEGAATGVSKTPKKDTNTVITEMVPAAQPAPATTTGTPAHE